MNKDPKHKTRMQDRLLSSQPTLQAEQWDSLESNSMSLAQVRSLKQQLQIGCQENKYGLLQNKDADSLQQSDEEPADDDDTEDLHDSLEAESHGYVKRKLTVIQTGYLETQLNKTEGTSQLLSNDAYSDLRYDPNWRSKLKRNDHFSESPQISIEEFYSEVPEEISSQSHTNKEELNGGYRYIVDTSPAIVVTPDMMDHEFDQPYCLHPQDDQTSSGSSPYYQKLALHLQPEFDLSNKNENDTLQRRFPKKQVNSCDIAKNIDSSSELTEDVCSVEFHSCCQQELRHTKGESIHLQKTSTSIRTNAKVLRSTRLERLTKDIVEHNKITLGRSTSKRDSYMRVHTLKQEMPHNANKMLESVEETASAENQEDSSDPKLLWLQKWQQLRVSKLGKGKNAQREECPNTPNQQQTRIRTEQGPHLSSLLSRAAVETQPEAQKMASSQPLPPTIHLNINLNTSSHLLSLLQRKEQDATDNLASLCGHTDWSHSSKVQLDGSPGYQQTDPEKPFYIHHRNLKSSPSQRHRTTALKLPLEDVNWSPDDVNPNRFPQKLSKIPTTTLSQGMGSQTVLPPIGIPTTGNEHELSSRQCVNTTYSIHRSSSDSYLNQMKKQKQLREKSTYKANILKDPKQLKPAINLQGLNPDYSATEKTKMKQQKLYSNMICEQNKKISRIPSLLAKNPEGNDKVPRMKALEYAKTISKPPLQSQRKQKQKQNQQCEDFTGHTPYIHDLDMSQLATLELLRKRHEEEKQAVAHLRKVHAV